jgi:hypothetical protein
METFVVAKKCQNVLLTTYDRELMPVRLWNPTKPGLERVLSWLSSECKAYLIARLTKRRLELC